MNILQHSHTTDDEKKFLRQRWRDGNIGFLKKYRKTLHLRKRWGNIDSENIKSYVDLLIKKLEESSD